MKGSWLQMSGLYLCTVYQKSFHWCLKKMSTTSTALPNFSKCTRKTTSWEKIKHFLKLKNITHPKATIKI